jgi:hypothetical protein
MNDAKRRFLNATAHGIRGVTWGGVYSRLDSELFPQEDESLELWRSRVGYVQILWKLGDAIAYGLRGDGGFVKAYKTDLYKQIHTKPAYMIQIDNEWPLGPEILFVESYQELFSLRLDLMPAEAIKRSKEFEERFNNLQASLLRLMALLPNTTNDSTPKRKVRGRKKAD